MQIFNILISWFQKIFLKYLYSLPVFRETRNPNLGKMFFILGNMNDFVMSGARAEIK